MVVVGNALVDLYFHHFLRRNLALHVSFEVSFDDILKLDCLFFLIRLYLLVGTVDEHLVQLDFFLFCRLLLRGDL